ncbi:inositol monophosphatase family protein [Mycobacteroides abscessus]|uniref:inositol monophosphatase family protein n=1 Tax=Mycobacteroides abscessus TaxID=36809 RepID=UPI0021029106|nr:inositol monophosphatase [Mycobacteroides abscessus]
MTTTAELEALVGEASVILDAAAQRFVAGHGAEGVVFKGGKDFATEEDLAIERMVVQALTERTGIGVHGEEFGGPAVDSGLVWVVDPIDGTVNYAAGSPMAAILLGLMSDGVPAAGLTWLPFMGEKYAAVTGGPLFRNGVAMPPLPRTDLADVAVGLGTFNVDWKGRVPGRYRLTVLEKLSRITSRLRMHGSTGIDLAFTAGGILGGAVSFGAHVWDHAAGIALVQAAGGHASDLNGEPWTPESPSLLVAAPGVQEQILEVLAEVGDPEDYR